MGSFHEGDRVAYSGKFLNQTGQHSGSKPDRRGTYLKADFSGFCRVRWDDEAATLAACQGQFADADYRDDVKKNGALVAVAVLAGVGSRAMGVN